MSKGARFFQLLFLIAGLVCLGVVAFVGFIEDFGSNFELSCYTKQVEGGLSCSGHATSWVPTAGVAAVGLGLLLASVSVAAGARNKVQLDQPIASPVFPTAYPAAPGHPGAPTPPGPPA